MLTGPVQLEVRFPYVDTYVYIIKTQNWISITMELLRMVTYVYIPSIIIQETLVYSEYLPTNAYTVNN